MWAVPSTNLSSAHKALSGLFRDLLWNKNRERMTPKPIKTIINGIFKAPFFSELQKDRRIVTELSSVTQSCPHGLQHARPPCPSSTPGVYSNSCPLSQWCHPTISSSVILFSSCLQSFPASLSFPMSWFFTSGGPKNWSCRFNTSPSNEYSRLISFRMDWLDLQQSKRFSRVFCNTTDNYY